MRLTGQPIVGPPRIIPNTIDLRDYQSSATKKPLRVVFLGRDEPRKGLDILSERDSLYLGRGVLYPIALEGALKL